MIPITYFRSQQIRSQFQQPLSAELLTQQQLLKQQVLFQQQQQQQMLHQNLNMTMNINSPKRVIGTGGNAISMGGLPMNLDGRQLISQTIIHQNYGIQPVQQPQSQIRPSRNLPTPAQCLQMSYYQTQQPQSIGPQNYYSELVHSQQVIKKLCALS